MFLDAGAFDEGLLFLQLGQAILMETEKTKLEFVEILIGHIVVLDLPGGFHDSFRQRANIHNRGVLLVLGADKKCGDATRIIIIGNLHFRIRQGQCKLFIRINFFVFLIVFNVFSDSID